MSQPFKDRYVSRDEHQKVVQYYTKLVANLYRQVCELRVAQVNPQEIDQLIEKNKQKALKEIRRYAKPTPETAKRGNVITVHFGRH